MGLDVHRYPRDKQTQDESVCPQGEWMFRLKKWSQFKQDVCWSQGYVEAMSGALTGEGRSDIFQR